jgi:hypothetical protein
MTRNCLLLGCLLGISLLAGESPVTPEKRLNQCNVVWDSPSADAHGSMPLGNGDIGISAWVEPTGDLVFYVSKTDAWDENGRLCKVGRVRVKFDPPLPVSSDFRQELKLREGVIEITAQGARLNLWVDANQPVVRLETEFATPVSSRARVELWRLRERPFGAEDDSHSSGGLAASAFKPTVLADVVVASEQPRIVWYHRNTRSVYALGLQVQHLEALKDRFTDPLLNLTFGASLTGTGFVRDGAQAIKSAAPAKRQVLAVTVLAAQTATPEAWLAQLDKLEQKPAASRRAHEAWWREFWDRSWIFVDGAQSLMLPDNAHPWRVGLASDGGSRFGGTITGPRVIGRALSATEIVQLAGQQPATETKLSQEALATGCTVAAWIKPVAREAGRILDKGTAGKPDGFTFDTYPGLSLRWIVGDHTMIHSNCLRPGEWQHVAATADTATSVRCIYLNGQLVMEERGDSAGVTVTRGYVLQRFMNACSGRGGSPIKFNGSIFTVEAKPGASPETPDGDPDWRRWGGNYWFQNTRLAYWPMLAAGDFDLMDAWFHMYGTALPFSEARIQTYYGFANAAQFPETMHWWGLPNNGDYGWTNPAPEPANSYIARYWSGSLELIAVMLDRYDFTQDRQFAEAALVPLADPLINFLNQYWSKRDTNGKIRFDPAQSLETWHSAVNPLPEIAGLRFLLPRLLALPDSVTTADQRARWQKLLAELPPVPVGEVNGVSLLRPAESFSRKSNVENPELYAVFPFRLYGVGRPELDMARDTYARRGNRHNQGWCQDSIQSACLGFGEEAARLVAARAGQINRAYRFPVMWGPNFDWIPDQDHGNNILTTLQSMLLQSDGNRLFVLPAWPKDWNVSFKLHAPKNTVVEGVYRSGKLEQLTVTPKSRRKDVIIMESK